MENLIPRLFNHDDAPLLETLTDLQAAMEYYQFIESDKVTARIAIMEFLRNNSEGEAIEVPSKIYGTLPKELNIREVEDGYISYNEIVQPSLFVFNPKVNPSTQFNTIINRAAKTINSSCDTNMDPNIAAETWKCFISNVSAMSNFVDPSIKSKYNNKLALMSYFINNRTSDGYLTLVELVNNCRRELNDVVNLFKNILDIVTNGHSDKPAIESEPLEILGDKIKRELNFMCSDSIFKSRKSIFPKWSEGHMSYEINKLLSEINKRVSVGTIKFLSTKRRIARLIDGVEIEKYIDKGRLELFTFDTSDGEPAIFARFCNSAGILTVDEEDGTFSIIALVHQGDFEYDTIDMVTGISKERHPFKRIPIIKCSANAINEGATLNIDEEGTITVTYNSKISPMDSYSELHHQLIIAYKANSGEDMKVILATVLYNITEYEREYYKLKRKGKPSDKMNEIERARMFLKNDFAQYFPKYLEYSNEEDFIKFYKSQGFGNKEYSVTTDTIRGLKKIIHAII